MPAMIEVNQQDPVGADTCVGAGSGRRPEPG
jgi:hypothetical protein